MGLIFLWNKFLKKIRGSAIRNSRIDRNSKVESGCQIVNSSFAKNSFCGCDCKILNCSVGESCYIGDGVIVGGSAHPIEWVSTSPVFYEGRDSVKKKFSEYKRKEDARTIIGNKVWIGERVLVKSGVKIGDGAVIEIGSVVTKNVGAYEVWGGNPAKCIEKRIKFDDKFRIKE